MRPSLVVLDDASEESTVRQSRSRLLAAAERHGVRTETVASEADGDLARYAALLATGQFAATYLEVGLGLTSRAGRGPIACRDMSAEGGTRAVVAALLANTGIAVTKFVAFLLTGASSMLAEAIHSVADSGNQGLLLLGGRQAQEGRDAGAPVRLRPRALHLLVPGRDRAVQRRRPVRALRGVPQVPRGPRAHGHPEDSLLDSRWWWVPLVVLRGRDRDGGVLLPHRDPSRPRRSRATRRTCSSSGAPSSPSCR